MQLTFWLTSLFDDDWNRGAYATECFEMYALHSTDFLKTKPVILLTSVRLIRLVMIENKPFIYTLKMHMYIPTEWALFLSILLRNSFEPLLVGLVIIENKPFIYTLKMHMYIPSKCMYIYFQTGFFFCEYCSEYWKICPVYTPWKCIYIYHRNGLFFCLYCSEYHSSHCLLVL